MVKTEIIMKIVLGIAGIVTSLGGLYKNVKNTSEAYEELNKFNEEQKKQESDVSEEQKPEEAK